MAQAAVRAASSVEERHVASQPWSEPWSQPWVGRSIERVEDAALLSGRGRFIDDLGVPPGTLHAAILRSSHAHADIVSIDAEAARQARGVAAVLTGEQIKSLTSSLVVGVKAPVECWPIATERVRYVGEPVAVVIATDRAKAEDAVELINVVYRTHAAVVDPIAALAPGAPVLHDGFPGNLASDRCFRYGNPGQAFAEAPHRFSIDIR
jgi:2-furoyl-CoA dehydrogenase large subunit